MVTMNEVPREREVFQTGWSLLKQGYDASTDKDWADLVNGCSNLIKSMSGTECETFAIDITKAIVSHIVRVQKGGADVS